MGANGKYRSLLFLGGPQPGVWSPLRRPPRGLWGVKGGKSRGETSQGKRTAPFLLIAYFHLGGFVILRLVRMCQLWLIFAEVIR